MNFDLVASIVDIEVIAEGRGIRSVRRLRKLYGEGHWRKMKGNTHVRLEDGTIVGAELHWYEAHGVGRREFKLKRIWDE